MYAGFVRCLSIVLFVTAVQAADSSLPIGVSDVSSLSETLAKYGPFGFTVLFLAAAGWTIIQANQATDVAKRSVLWKFAWAAFGLMVVFALLGGYYWQTDASSIHVFEGQILEIPSYDQVFPQVPTDEMYLKTIPGQRSATDPDPPSTIAFAAIQRGPFTEGQQIGVEYEKKDQKERRQLTVAYQDSKTVPRYKLHYETEADKWSLISADQSSGGSTSARYMPSPLMAFAQAPPRQAAAAVQNTATQSAAKGVDMQLVNLLQNSSTTVGVKIDTLNQLRSLPPTTQKAYAETVTNKESFALTLIELSRHSDPELSFKAQTVAKTADATSVLAAQLSSPAAGVQNAARQAVLRVSQQRAQEILKQAPPTPQNAQLSAQVQAGVNQQVLVPVGTTQGDLYYVQSHWDPKNAKTVQCLGTLFYGQAPTTKSPQEETKAVATTNERLNYRYTKDLALSLAQAIRSCGGTVSFPNPVAKLTSPK